MEHILYTLALGMVTGIGPTRYRHLLRIFGSPKAVLSSSRKELRRISFLSFNMVNEITGDALLEAAHQVLEQAEKQDLGVHGMHDESYPYRLRQIPDAPLVLFSKGPCHWNQPRMVAVVGTRSPSSQALSQTRNLVEDLSVAGISVISGLAFGIDAMTHRTALESRVPTMGVLGGAIDKPYPTQHRSLMEKMCVSGGLISEFYPGVKAEREHFPMRNRIIAGMADIVIVIESARKGGSMITARLANDYDREVGAFPGTAGNEKAGGCNFLIKNHQAHLVESAADIFALMQWDEADGGVRDRRTIPDELTGEQLAVYHYIREHGPIHLDELIHGLDLTPGQWSLLGLSMEMAGYIVIHPGNMIALQ